MRLPRKLIVFVVTCFATIASLGIQSRSQSARFEIRPYDDTSLWIFPYIATESRSRVIIENYSTLKPKVSLDEVVKQLGKPDAIQDLRDSYMGLSPKEDGFLMQYRDSFSYRAVWYLSKKGAGANVYDKWITAYVGNDRVTVLKFMANNMDQK